MVALEEIAPAEHLRRARALLQHNGVQFAVVLRIACLGKVEHRRAAVHEIEELYAPADAEHRQLPLGRRMEQPDFEIIPHVGDALRLALVACVIGAARRVDVPAAREDHAVKNVPIVKGIGQEHRR